MNFEKEYVHKFYSLSAREFSQTRVKPWPFATSFIQQLGPSQLLLDAGCGNGRQFLHGNTVGVDFSGALLAEAAAKQNIGLVQADVHSLPFRDGVFDAVVSIAVLHHLHTDARRLAGIREMRRVLKADGRCLVYVWHKEASRKGKFRAVGPDEYLVSWRNGEGAERYYYLYDEEGLRDLAEKGGLRVVDMGREEESIYAVLAREG